MIADIEYRVLIWTIDRRERSPIFFTHTVEGLSRYTGAYVRCVQAGWLLVLNGRYVMTEAGRRQVRAHRSHSLRKGTPSNPRV